MVGSTLIPLNKRVERSLGSILSISPYIVWFISF